MENKLQLPISNIMYDSLSGTGKTYILGNRGKEAKNQDKNILYLSFNKHIRFEVIKKYGLTKQQVHTFHSLAYSDMIGTDFLNDILGDYDDQELYEYFEKDYKYFTKNNQGMNPGISKTTLNNLLEWWCEYPENSKFNNLDYIIVDEYQDLNRFMLKVLRNLYKLNKGNGVKVIVAGDKYQHINSFLNSGKVNKNFEKFGRYFKDYKNIVLNHNFRSSASLQKFYNGYYEINYDDNRYFDVSRYNITDYTDDVFIHAIQHKKNVVDEVKQIIKQYSTDKTIKILGRVNKELEVFHEDDYFDMENIDVSTIHSEKGNEADIIIVINTIFNDKLYDMEAKNIWNVAITRAKEKLHIVSSFSKEQLLQMFKSNTYVLIDNQVKIFGQNIKDISKSEIELTLDKVSKSIIDSLEVQLDYKNANNIPHEKQNLEKNSPFKTDTQKVIKNYSTTIHRHNSKLTFDFRDLNPFKNDEMNDVEVLDYIKEVQREYFNHLISDNDILSQKVRRLDLAKYFKVPNNQMIEFLNLIFKLSRNGIKSKDIKDEKDDLCGLYMNSNSKKT